jgi:hypothetical protein
MMRKVHVVYVFILFFIAGSVNISAQDTPYSDRKEIANEAIKLLKDGILIIRLKSKHNKLVALNELLEQKTPNTSEYEDIQAEIQNTIYERDRFNRSLVESFEKGFTFSDIYYVYDTASTSLRSGVRQGIFLNASLELDPNIEIPDKPFFVGKIGNTNSASTTGVEALVLMDRGLNDLERPFPYYVRVNSIERVFLRVFNPRKLVRKDSEKIVEKLEQKLQDFWLKLPKNENSEAQTED